MLGLYLTYVYFVIIKKLSKEFKMFKKAIYTVVALLCFYTLLGFVALPFLLKSQAIKYVKNNLNKELTVENIQFNPYTFKLHIQQLALNDNNNKMMAFENLFLEFDMSKTLSNGYLHINSLHLTQPFVNVEINQNNELNLTSLVPKSSSNSEDSSELLALQVDTFVMDNGEIKFSDFSQNIAFKMVLNNLNYTLDNFNTQHNHLSQQLLSAKLNDQTQLMLKGELVVNPLKTQGTLEINNLLIEPFWKLFQEQYEFMLDKKLTLDSKLSFALDLETEPTISINNSSIKLKNMNIQEKNKETLLSLNTVEFNQLNMKFPKTPNTHLLESNFNLLLPQGKLISDFLVDLNTLNTQANYTFSDISLDIFNPILSKSTFIDIKSAFLNAKGNLKYENNILIANADASLKDVHLNHHQKPLFKAKELLAKNLYFDQVYNVLSIDNMNITTPYVFVQINEKSEVNLTKLTKISSTENRTNDKEEPFTVYIGPLTINNGQMTFEDLTLPIHFKIENENINGTLSEFNTKSSKPTLVKLDGNIGKYGHMKLNGNLVHNDFKSFSDFKITFDNLALKDLSGYSSKYIGRKIEDGKLSLNLSYHIDKSKLEAKNDVVISKIKLGEKIQSEKAMSLPLELAIAILEDKNGVIDIKLPLNGNLDDPEFSIAPIIWQAFTNLIAKAITSPFSLLASIFGFGEDEINHIPFYFGNATITAVQKESLDNIAQILSTRTKLSVELSPSYDEKNDLWALQEMAFQKSMETGMIHIKKEEYDREYMALLEKNYTLFSDDIEKVKTKHLQDNVLNERFYKQELEKFLIGKQKIEPEELELLAKNRTVQIKNYLIQQKISKEQIVILKEVEKKSNNSKFSEIGLQFNNLIE